MELNLILVVFSALLLSLGAFSSTIKKVWLSVPLLSLVAGVALGPRALDIVNLSDLGDPHKILEEVARITLAVSLMATGLQFTRNDLWSNRVRVGLLLTVVMAAMWIITGLLAWSMFDVSFWLALLIAAVLTPTDPVVAATLVTGLLAEENLPRWLRRSLQLESGANDGLAVVFVLLPAIVLSEPTNQLSIFALEAFRQVAIAVAGGAALGWLAGHTISFAVHRHEIDRGYLLSAGLALALLSLGAIHLLGGAGILASFVAGLVFSITFEGELSDELERVQDAVEKIVIVPVFTLFGTLLPWTEWARLGWLGVGFAVAVLLLRRPPVVWLTLARADTEARGRAFLGWFGPIGVAAIYYSLYVERYDLIGYQTLFGASTLAISASVIVHSITATPAVRAFAGRSLLATLFHPLRPGIEKSP